MFKQCFKLSSVLVTISFTHVFIFLFWSILHNSIKLKNKNGWRRGFSSFPWKEMWHFFKRKFRIFDLLFESWAKTVIKGRLHKNTTFLNDGWQFFFNNENKNISHHHNKIEKNLTWSRLHYVFEDILPISKKDFVKLILVSKPCSYILVYVLYFVFECS